MLIHLKWGSTGDPENFINAVISEISFDKIVRTILNSLSKILQMQKFLIGGNYDKSKGYFIEPTVIKTNEFQIQNHEVRKYLAQ